jgi:hypothetical protein
VQPPDVFWMNASCDHVAKPQHPGALGHTENLFDW